MSERDMTTPHEVWTTRESLAKVHPGPPRSQARKRDKPMPSSASPKPATDHPRWGSIALAAETVGCSDRTIRRWISEGRLTGYRLGSRAIRVDLNELDALFQPIPAAGERIA